VFGQSNLLETRMNELHSTALITEFAPAERASSETVQRQAALLARQPLISELLNSVLDYVLILNPQRQIVFASRNVQHLVPGMALEDLLGRRPGEALGCTHAGTLSGGCGTTAFCRECGAARAILASLAGTKDCRECRMVRVANGNEEALDLLVTGTPLTLAGETYSLVAMADISHEKRRQALERIFFHDILNSAGGLEGRILLLDKRVPGELREQVGWLRAGLHQVLEEIVAQRDLLAAESNELAVDPQPVRSRELLEMVLRLYAKHPVAEKRGLELDPAAAAVDLVTDARLLRRILGNLVKNALEASQPGQVVTAGCGAEPGGVRFWVRNPTFMPSSVQRQVFNRSFSTKGAGRGLGTYSVKLLTERYLKGKAGFTSSEADGTTFFVILPALLGGNSPKTGFAH
jgi:signal transduction histidine kinase